MRRRWCRDAQVGRSRMYSRTISWGSDVRHIPVNEEVVLNRQSRLKRVMAKINKGIAEAPFNISQSVLPISVDELLTKLEERRRCPLVGRT